MNINKIIKEYVEGEVELELRYEKTKIRSIEKENVKLRKEKEELEDELKRHREQIKQLQSAVSVLPTIKEKLNEDNIENLLVGFGYQREEQYRDHYDKAPKWFALIMMYYSIRETVLNLLDLAQIEYPSWAKSIKLPQDFDEQEVEWFLSNKSNYRGYYDEMMGGNRVAYYKPLKAYKGNIKDMLNREPYLWAYSLPLDSLLKNPLLITDRFFEKILNIIDTKEEKSHYFFEIASYQRLDDRQIKALADRLPKKSDELRISHERFIEECYETLNKLSPDYMDRYIDEISTSEFDTFFYERFPKHTQKQFIINHKHMSTLRKFDIVIESKSLNDEEKVSLIKQVAEKELMKEC